MKRNLRAAGFVLIGLIVLKFVAGIFIDNKFKQDGTSNIQNTNARGVSVLNDFMTRAKSPLKKIQKNYLVLGDELNQTQILLVVAPLALLTERELAYLHQWMLGGRTLWISAEDEPAKSLLAAYLNGFGLKHSVEARPDFSNEKIDLIKVTEDAGPYQSGKDYAFYSPLQFEGCSEQKLSCFFRAEKVGKGALWISLGLFPLANGLLESGRNREILFALHGQKLGFDENVHGFGEKSASDLLLNPQFIVPLLLIVLISFFVFFFFRSDSELPTQKSIVRPRDYHDFHKEVMRGLWDSHAGATSLVALHSELLKKKNIPHSETPVHLKQGVLKVGRELMQALKDYYQKRGRNL